MAGDMRGAGGLAIIVIIVARGACAQDAPVADAPADVGLGVSWNWTAFDRKTNPTNTALGSDVAYHFDGGVSVRLLATERASVYGGLSVMHWSNGATKLPNLGLAVVGPKVAVRYNFAPQPPRARAGGL